MTHLLLYALLGSSFNLAHADAPSCCTFPTFEKPVASYEVPPRKFGSPRAKGRLHAACDLYQSTKGLGVRAVSEGTVIRDLYYFYQGTYAIEVQHASGFVVRYGEVTGSKAKGIKKGAALTEGQLLGYVGKVNSGCCDPMLHFEKYSGAKKGALTQPKTNKYQRRSDLQNATGELLQWESTSFAPPLPIVESPKQLPSVPLLTSSPPYVRESASFTSLLKILVQYVQTPASPSRLFEDLKKLGVEPTMSSDDSAWTGSLTIIQSRAETLGAHHFHAQYFGDASLSPFIQHLSFELRPGIKTFPEVVKSLSESFALTGLPKDQTEDFAQWPLEGNKVLWVKRLAKEDLLDNPFYRYSEQDLGSIRIAIEILPE